MIFLKRGSNSKNVSFGLIFFVVRYGMLESLPIFDWVHISCLNLIENSEIPMSVPRNSTNGH